MAERMTKAEERIKGAYSRFTVVGLVVGLVALLATVASVVIVLRSEKTEVAAQVLASDELTTYHPELEARFTYGGEEVTHLWKLKVRFVNSGDRTIVGEGNQKNIIGEGINFMFPDNTRILRVEEEANTFQSTIMQPEPNQLQIRFRQWRSGEYSIKSLCVASDKPLYTAPLPEAPTRDIVDGDMVVEDLTERRPEAPMFAIDRLPAVVSVSGKIIGGLIAGLAGLLALILVGMGISGWKPASQFDKWKKQHLSSFSEYLAQLKPALSEGEKQKFKKEPYTLPEALWANFKGEKVPKKPTSWDSRGACIVSIVVPAFVLFGSISLILMLLPA